MTIEFHKIWIEQCEGARGIKEAFGAGKAIGYLIGEKLVNFVRASDTHPEFAAELPEFVAEVKRIFEPHEIREYLENVRRIGEVAKLFADAGLVVLTSFISPYRSERRRARQIAGAHRFLEVFVDCPIEVCEERDVKGMYAKARRGEIKNFTGIDDPYERPENPEISIDTTAYSPEENARRVIDYLVEEGFVRALVGR